MRKPKEELVKELETVLHERDEAKAEAKEASLKAAKLQEELAKAEQTQKMFDDMYEAALQLKATQDAFIKAGFDEEQAFEIMLNMMISCTQPKAPTVGSLLDLAIR